MPKWLKALKKALNIVETIAPVLPIPDPAKRVIAKTGETERDVEDIVRELKPPKSAAPTATPPKSQSR